MSPKRRRAPGEGSIYFHDARGLWCAQVDLGKDAIGKRLRRTIYGKSRREVQQKVADLKARGGGTVRPRAAGTIGEWVERWLEGDVKPNQSENTFVLYEGMWRVHAAPVLASRSLEKFDIEDVSSLYAHLRQKGASPSIVKNVAKVLARALNVAIRRRIFHKVNPFSLVEQPRYEPKEVRALDVEEARRFLHAAHDDRFEALWIILLTAGLRIGEVQALEWRDIDFKSRSLSVRQSLIEINGYVKYSKTKTKGSRRRIDLGDLAIAALKRRLAAHDQELHGSPLVFCTENGTPMRRSNLRRSHLFPILKGAGLGHLTIHGLRHTMTTLGMSEGVSPKVLAERLGHSTVRLTQDRYGHVLPGMQRDAADQLDDLFSDRS